VVDERLRAPLFSDANVYICAWEFLRSYDPTPSLEKITAAVLAILPGSAAHRECLQCDAPDCILLV